MFSPVVKSCSLFALLACVLLSSLPALHAKYTVIERERPSYDKQGGIWKREEHNHEHEHAESEELSSCGITEHVLAHEFTELAEEMSLTDGNGELCIVEEEGEHGHEGEEHGHEGEEHGHEGEELGEHNETSHLHNETFDLHNITSNLNLTCSSCDVIYNFVQELLIRLNVTTPCCLGNTSACDFIDLGSEPVIFTRTDPAKAYGYGFLMVSLISACSLLGVLLLPLLNKDNKFHSIYKYFYALLIALGTSALFCDAILHLIPEAFGLHDHGGPEEGHAHEGEGEEEDRSFIWKGVIVIVGLYLFYLFEVTLHSWNVHSHHTHHQMESNSSTDSDSQNKSLTKGASLAPCREPTMPHGVCRDKCLEDSDQGSILHPRRPSCSCEDPTTTTTIKKTDDTKRCSFKIKPLALVIILGDAIHNFADGLALGAAISQSLSLGVSTMIAIILHELPHELGDFAILLSTGLSWYTALFFNFVSSLTAVVGFFVGVAIGTASTDANSWILAAAAGVFLYIALVDLLPELIHIKEKGRVRFLLIMMANIGFIISFVVLLLIAIYEENLNTLISV